MNKLFQKRLVHIKEIVFFSFSYTQGYCCNANARYQLEWRNGGYVASVKPVGKSQEDAKTVSVPDTFARKLEKILTEHGVSGWNGFQKSNKQVLDGDSFGLSVTFMDQSGIEAQGYMRWPREYGAVKQEILSLFAEAIPS